MNENHTGDHCQKKIDGMERLKVNDKAIGYDKLLIVLFQFLFIKLLMVSLLVAQEPVSYFEQQGNTISIEAENGLGYGWVKAFNENASDNYVIYFPKTDTLIFPVVDDTYINYYAPETNYGANPELVVDGRGGDKRGFYETPWGTLGAFERASFLKFDVTGLQDIIVEAQIYLYCIQTGIGGGIYSLDPMKDNLNWSELQATWNNRPSVDHDGNTFHSYVGQVLGGNWYSFDVTRALSGKGDGSYSFGIVAQENDYTVWSSKEGDYPPYLVLRVKSTGPSIFGKTLYYSNNNPIANVRLYLSGGENRIQISNLSGSYEFLNLIQNENYTTVVSKLENTDIGPYTITTYDAALAAQAAVGVRTLTDYESIAADVSKDGVILTYDAALIAQYSVGLPKLSTSHVGEWEFIPDTMFYQTLSEDKVDQNFIGIILGNVHGGWSQPESYKRSIAYNSYEELRDMTVEYGEEVIIPLLVSAGQNIISTDIDFRYDPAVLKFHKIIKTDLSREMEIYLNDEPGRLRLSAYSIFPINESGALINLAFNVIEENNQHSWLSLDRFQLNNNNIMTARATLVVGGKWEKPLKYSLGQSYPNPFMAGGSRGIGTVMNYQIPRSERVVLKVYNYLGQEVRTLLNEEKRAGRYQVYWDGRNEQDELVSAGLYFYRFTAGNYVQMRRLILLR